jgi:hypothetical protein
MSEPFPDRNLRLALLDQVRRVAGGYSWVATERDSYLAARRDHPTWPDWSEIEAIEDEHSPALEAHLLGLPIDEVELGALTSLTLDGDRDLYQWVFSSWWDFGEHFVIRDLSGLERCGRLRYLLLGQGVVEGASLAPLRALQHLEELHACARTGLRDLDTILALPALRKLDVVNVATSDQRADWERVLERIAAR